MNTFGLNLFGGQTAAPNLLAGESVAEISSAEVESSIDAVLHARIDANIFEATIQPGLGAVPFGNALEASAR